MNLEPHGVELRLSQGLINLKDRYNKSGVMDGRKRKISSPPSNEGKSTTRDYHRSFSQGNSKRSFPTNYFSVESFVVLVCLTASLLILPLILPPLPPPPFMLLLLPIGILALLMILAFMSSDIRDIASSYT